MIESFSVTNLFSYKQEQTLSFIASNKEKDRDEIVKDKWFKIIDDKRILKLIILVGNNGTGKSKLIEALDYFSYISTNNFTKNESVPYQPFLLDKTSREADSELKILFYLNDSHYEYYISTNNGIIKREELKLLAGKNSAKVYTRTTDSNSTIVDVTFGSACDLSKTEQKELYLHASPNNSILSTYSSLNIQSDTLSSIYTYFFTQIGKVYLGKETLAEKLQTDDLVRDKIMHTLLLQLFRDLTINIVDYKVEKISLDFMNDPNISPDFLKYLLTRYPDGKQKVLNFIHGTPRGNYDIVSDAESQGTLNIIQLLIIMYDIIFESKTSCVDEVERGIDSKALAFLFKMYLTLSDNSQLILATQEHTLMDKDFIRRDSIREITKDSYGCSEIHPINQSNIHRNNSLYNWYEEKTNRELRDKLDDQTIYRKYSEIFHSR